MRALHDFAEQDYGSELTPRQVQVLELVAKRRSLKQVACELSISESAVNQHIKALKVSLSANSLPELAEIHRATAGLSVESTCRKSASRKSGLSGTAESGQQSLPDGLEPVLSFHDGLNYRLSAPWETMAEPMIVPGVLNGTNSRWVRAAVMVAITIGLFAAVIVGLGAAQGVSSALTADGSASERN